MRFVRVFACAAVLLPAPVRVRAQQTQPSHAELIQSLIDQVRKLERRVAELEGRGPAQPSPVQPSPGQPSSSPAVAAPPAAETKSPMGHPEHLPSRESALSAYPSFKLAGFTDINFAASDLPRARSGFNEGQFILHFSAALSQKVNFLGELSFTARPDGGIGIPAAPGFNAEIERSIIRFEQNDYFKVSFGRYHTPINYWNTAFHHGQWLQTTVSRPEMTQFGGSFIPVHFVGGLVEGVTSAGGLNLNYNVGVGNGRGSVIGRAGDFGDSNNNRAWLVNLFARPDNAYGLQFGGSIYRDKISPLTGPPGSEWIQSAHIVWQKENPELIAEFANVSHTPSGSSRSSNSQAWYVQTAYRLPFAERLWKPYYRFEYIHIPRGDVFFRAVSSLAGSVVGVRYDISSFAAVKFEYRNQRRPGLPRVNAGFIQTSFTF